MYKDKAYKLSLKGSYQPSNAAAAIEAAHMLTRRGFRIDEADIEYALANTRWQARYEFLTDRLVIDGGHNSDGIRALTESLQEDGRRIFAVAAMMADKSVNECVKKLASCCERIYCTQLDMPRCALAEEIADIARESCADVRICHDSVNAVREALADSGEDTLVCVCGSLYLAGEIRRAYGKNKQHEIRR